MEPNQSPAGIGHQIDAFYKSCSDYVSQTYGQQNVDYLNYGLRILPYVVALCVPQTALWSAYIFTATILTADVKKYASSPFLEHAARFLGHTAYTKTLYDAAAILVVTDPHQYLIAGLVNLLFTYIYHNAQPIILWTLDKQQKLEAQQEEQRRLKLEEQQKWRSRHAQQIEGVPTGDVPPSHRPSAGPGRVPAAAAAC